MHWVCRDSKQTQSLKKDHELKHALHNPVTPTYSQVHDDTTSDDVQIDKQIALKTYAKRQNLVTTNFYKFLSTDHEHCL